MNDKEILEVFPNGSCYNTEIDFKENTVILYNIKIQYLKKKKQK